MSRAAADAPAGAEKGSNASKAADKKKTSSGATGSSSSTASKPGGMPAAAAAASTALAAAKLGLPDQLSSALAVAPAAACLRDVDGRCCLHYAAGFGHEECVDVLLEKAGVEAVKVRDSNGDLPLHLAAQQGNPMCAYNIAKVRMLLASASSVC
jgi:hypothetical protein